MDSTVTITFCECGENYVGMQEVGKRAEPGDGFTLFDLQRAALWCEEKGVEYELWDLRPEWENGGVEGVDLDPAYILIMRKAVSAIINKPRALYNELVMLEWDKKILNNYKKVVNKHARHNLVFADEPWAPQEPDYEAGKGRIVPYYDVPLLSKIRDELVNIIGYKAEAMIGEGNHYYRPGKTGIGWHGDTERRMVIGVRQGVSMSLAHRWYHRWQPVSDIIEFEINHDDMYIFSEKAVGTDWKSSSIYTLRHSAGVDTKGKAYD